MRALMNRRGPSRWFPREDRGRVPDGSAPCGRRVCEIAPARAGRSVGKRWVDVPQKVDSLTHKRSTQCSAKGRLPVRYFVDPSIGPAALGIGTGDLTSDLEALRFHYEALVVRDLRIYAQPLDARVDSWRDADGHEVDAIVSIGPNRWGAFEIKLHPNAVDDAAASLLRFAAKVDTTRQGEPSCLGVITSTGAGGLRPDGVHVIPIGALGP